MPVLPRGNRRIINEEYSAVNQQFTNPPLSKKQRKQVKLIAKSKQEQKRIVNTGSVGVYEGQYHMVNPLYNIAQGLTASDRIGSSINLDSIEIKYYFTTKGGTAISEAFLRIFMYWSDVESITSSSTPTTVTNANLLTTLPLVGNVASGFAPLLQLDQFQAVGLRDKLEVIHIPSATNDAWMTGTLKVKFKGRKCTYLHDSASYMDGKNLYFGVAGSNNGTVNVTQIGNFFYTSKVNFRE